MNEQTGTEPATDGPSSSTLTPWWPYVLPMAVFMVLTSLEGTLPKGTDGGPHPTWYPIAYAVKLVAVIAMLAIGHVALRDLRPKPDLIGWLLAAGLGLAVLVMWVGLERLPYPKWAAAGSRQAFDPYVLSPTPRGLFLAARFLGLVVVVPVMEELFWRSFVVRWVIDPNFGRVPIGRMTPMAAGISSALFAAAHPEWLPALLTGLAWAWLLWKSRSLLACVVSHAVTNLGLGLYVLSTGSWELW